MTKPTDRPKRSQTANESEPTKASPEPKIPESLEGSTWVLWFTQGSSENRESVFKKPLGLLMKSKKRR